MKLLTTVLIAAGISSLISIAAPARAAAPESKSQITILYDAFGTDPSMTKDWGFTVQGRVHCECKVLDVSKNGAKIITEEQVPDRFQLAFFQGGENRVCEVIWRRAKMLGVKFIF